MDQKVKAATCHTSPDVPVKGLPFVTIVGNPNVGKSVLFNLLTGAYVTVSNYPGTTVDVSRGKGQIENSPGFIFIFDCFTNIE